MLKFFLSEAGLETVADACARKGWSAKTLQNWINAGLIAACVVGGGRGTSLLRIADVDAFAPPADEYGRGRPLKTKPTRKPRARPVTEGDPPTTPPPRPTPTRKKGRPRKATG